MTDEALTYLWLSVAITLSVVTTLCITVPLGIVASKTARLNPFNLYLVFLMVPDVFFTGMCTITCSLNFAAGQYYSMGMCKFQNWYTIFGVAGNAWLNCLVAYEVHKLLRFSYVRKKYYPPGRTTVVLQAIAVYAYAALIASVGTFFAVSPEASEALMEGSIACFPTKYDSATFYWLFLAPAMFVVPLLVILWICIDVYRRELLPPNGRTRLLAMYFLRLVTIFLVMWIPYFVITTVSTDPWALLVGGMWGHLQIVASASFSLTKPDVRRSVSELPCFPACFVGRGSADGDGANQTNGKRVGASKESVNAYQRRVSRVQRRMTVFAGITGFHRGSATHSNLMQSPPSQDSSSHEGQSELEALDEAERGEMSLVTLRGETSIEDTPSNIEQTEKIVERNDKGTSKVEGEEHFENESISSYCNESNKENHPAGQEGPINKQGESSCAGPLHEKNTSPSVEEEVFDQEDFWEENEAAVSFSSSSPAPSH